MLVRNKKQFARGMVLLCSFFVVLAFIFSPVLKDDYGRSVNGLSFADDMFNSLSKGSAYYIPKVTKKVQTVQGAMIDVTVKQDDAAAAAQAAKIVTLAGLTAQANGESVHITGDLGKLLNVTVAASQKLYDNDDKAVSDMFGGLDGRAAMKDLWKLYNPMVKALQKQKMISEASVVSTTITKAIEPSYNFFGIKGERVSDRAGTVTLMLCFYVLYTLWYGYAIFDLFCGFGLSMSKAKHKKEV